MKKILKSMMAAVMTLATIMPVAATQNETVTEFNHTSDAHDVTLSTQVLSENRANYAVDIYWGSLEIDLEVNSVTEWNTETLLYDTKEEVLSNVNQGNSKNVLANLDDDFYFQYTGFEEIETDWQTVHPVIVDYSSIVVVNKSNKELQERVTFTKNEDVAAAFDMGFSDGEYVNSSVTNTTKVTANDQGVYEASVTTYCLVFKDFDAAINAVKDGTTMNNEVIGTVTVKLSIPEVM